MAVGARRPADVGPLVAEFRPRPVEIGALFGTALVLGLVAIGLATASALLPALSSDTRLIVGLIAALIAAASAHLAWRTWRRRGFRVRVGRDGLGRRWRGRDEAYRWDEVLGVALSGADESDRSLDIEFLDGNAWQIDGGLAGFDRLRALIAARGRPS